MPGLDPGIDDFLCRQDVDGRDKPGHDEVVLSFRGDAKHRTRNLEIPGSR
jgi:hypothetical protein